MIDELEISTKARSIGEWSESEKTEFVSWIYGVLKSTEKVTVTFEKKDGTIREMNCTLKDVPEYVPKTETVRKKSESTISVYDIDNQDWRSFRIDSVRHVGFTL
jgi:hypothetical protein